MDQNWIFYIAENDPEYLLAMGEDEFRAMLLEAGFHAEELSEQFDVAINALIDNLRNRRMTVEGFTDVDALKNDMTFV